MVGIRLGVTTRSSITYFQPHSSPESGRIKNHAAQPEAFLTGFIFFDLPSVGASVCVLMFLCTPIWMHLASHTHPRFTFRGLPSGPWSTPGTQTARSAWETPSPDGPMAATKVSPAPLDNSQGNIYSRMPLPIRVKLLLGVSCLKLYPSLPSSPSVTWEHFLNKFLTGKPFFEHLLLRTRPRTSVSLISI